jgi:hypothetical protein
MRLFRAFLCLLLILSMNSTVFAQTSTEDELRDMKTQMALMQERMAKLEEKITAQESSKQAYEQRITSLQEQLAQYQASSSAALSSTKPAVAKWTPEIGVVVDTVFTSDTPKEDEEGADRLSVRELELVLGSEVDPYSRLDATISLSDFEDTSLEEAYLTRFGLPLDTTARIGKFKPKVGKALAMHRDSLDTVDEPLVIQRYFGVEGLNKSGVDLTKTLDLPIPLTQQLSIGVIDGGNGEDGTAFGETRRRPTVYSHLKNYVDVTETTGFELGLSHMAGSRDEDAEFEVQILAADATLKHDFNVNQSMKVQGEVFNLNRKESYLDSEEDIDGLGEMTIVRRDIDGNLWGSYGLIDFRIHPQWSTGFRYDNVQLVDNPFENPKRKDVGYTGYLTFHQSEFVRWRAQYTHKDLATGKDDDAVFLQGTFAIGEHKHKMQ